MANRPLPTEAVIVNISRIANSVPENYLREFGIVSLGETNLAAGEYKTISSAEIETLGLSNDSYTRKWLNSFFANATRANVNVIETGINPNKSVDNRINKPSAAISYNVGDYYIDTASNKAMKCIQADTATDATNATPAKLADTAYWEETTKLKSYAIGSIYTEGTTKYEAIQTDAATALLDLEPTNLTNAEYWTVVKAYAINDTYTHNNITYRCIKADNAISIHNLQPTNIDYKDYWELLTATIADAVNALSSFITENKKRIYKYSVPNAMYSDSSFATLCKKYTSLNASQYFSSEIDYGKSPETDSKFVNIKGLKSFMPIYPSAVSDESVDGAITGILAGQKYDLSSTNPLSLLQWTSPLGITPNDNITSAMQKALNENGCSWVSTYAANICILGGMYADGEDFHYYYALDNILYKLETELTLRLIQASNTPSLRIPYNQNGINELKAKHEAIFNTLVSYGCIDEYGQSYDNVNSAITDTGVWKATAYATYRSENLANVNAGIYDGFSVYVRIVNFVLQIIDNITIE